MTRVSRLLRDWRPWRLLARGVKVIRWPKEAGELHDPGLLKATWATLTAHGKRLWDWVRAWTRVVLPRRLTYASRWNHIRTAKTSSMRELLASGRGGTPPTPEDQRQMTRIKRYWHWKLPVNVYACSTWSRSMKVRKKFVRDW